MQARVWRLWIQDIRGIKGKRHIRGVSDISVDWEGHSRRMHTSQGVWFWMNVMWSFEKKTRYSSVFPSKLQWTACAVEFLMSLGTGHVSLWNKWLSPGNYCGNVCPVLSRWRHRLPCDAGVEGVEVELVSLTKRVVLVLGGEYLLGRSSCRFTLSWVSRC